VGKILFASGRIPEIRRNISDRILSSLNEYLKVIKLHNEKLNDLYCYPNTTWVLKSRGIRLARHVASMGQVG
jgi:hypothetical protein